MLSQVLYIENCFALLCNLCYLIVQERIPESLKNLWLQNMHSPATVTSKRKKSEKKYSRKSKPHPQEEDSMLIICYLSSFFSIAFLFLFPMNKYSVGYHKIEAATQQQTTTTTKLHKTRCIEEIGIKKMKTEFVAINKQQKIYNI